MIVLTSFAKQPKGIPGISIARYQPKNFRLPELRFLAPMDRYGNKLQGYLDHKEYRALYRAILLDRKAAVLSWISSLDKNKTFALICWCNSLQQAAKGYSTIMCHTILLGFSIAKRRKDILVTVDQDRFSHSIWKHDFSLFNIKRWRRNEASRKSKSLY